MHFYHVVLFFLAAMIVFPDKILEEIEERIEKSFGLWPLILSELCYVAAALALTFHLKAMGPALSWWEPVLLIGFWLVMRGVYSLVSNLLDEL